MSPSRVFKTLLPLAAALLCFHTQAAAQSGRRRPTPRPPPNVQPAPAPTPADGTHYDMVKVVVARGLDDFVKALNEQGGLGYRLEKTAGYGDPKGWQRYAAVLHLDPGHRYDYKSEPLPEDAKYGDPLDYYPRRGYTLAHTYAVTRCPGFEVYDPHDPNAPNGPYTPGEAEVRGNVLLFMRRDAAGARTKEYRLFKGVFTLDGGQKEELQAALNAAPPGFEPVRLLFSARGSLFFNVAVVAERDPGGAAPRRVEYQLVKEVFGFEEGVNRLAAAGSRYVGGGRRGFVKFALLARQAGEAAAAYTFKDARQLRREFPRMLAAGNSYVGLLADDPTCDSGEVQTQKLVFERDAGGAHAREYRTLELSDRRAAMKPGVLSDAAVSELRRLLADGSRVRDIFYADGLHAILERQTAPPSAPQAQTSER
jgi:hypothetical protein